MGLPTVAETVFPVAEQRVAKWVSKKAALMAVLRAVLRAEKWASA